MQLRNYLSALAVLLLVAGGQAAAGEVVVTQKAKKFDKKKITIKKGDSIKFVNADSVAHNVHSRSKGGKFDLGVQKPNTNSSHTFTESGKFKVRCAIHPKMKITVTVE